MRGLLTLMMAAYLGFVLSSQTHAEPLGTAFTYQGKLEAANQLAEGTYDFEFELYDSANGGVSIDDVLVENVSVRAGIFSAQLDFGEDVFAGERRWLAIGVRDTDSTDPFERLSPRQEITPAPYAVHAQYVGANAVSGFEILDGSIEAVDLAAGAVSANELANDAVNRQALADNAVASAEVMDESITADDLAPNSVGTSELVDGSVGAAQINTGQVQRRVTGICFGGLFVRAINADGSVQCGTPPIGLKYTLDADAGRFPSVTVRQQSQRPLISYQGDDLALNLFDCSDPTCSFGGHRVLDATVNVGSSSIAVRSNGLPIISYEDISNDDLRVFDCSTANCSSGTVRTLDSTDFAGRYSSIKIRNGNLPIISYQSINTNGKSSLFIYDCDDSGCASGSGFDIDGFNDVGAFTSLDLRHDETPVISYFDETNDDLMVYRCNNSECSSGSRQRLDSTGNVGRHSSLVVRSHGLPIISYFDATNGRLKVYDCADAACSTGTARVLDSASNVGTATSIAHRPVRNLPIISYYDSTNRDLKLYDCTSIDCSTGVALTLDGPERVGGSSSIAIRNSGVLPIIAYSDFSNGALKVYSCGDSRCEN